MNAQIFPACSNIHDINRFSWKDKARHLFDKLHTSMAGLKDQYGLIANAWKSNAVMNTFFDDKHNVANALSKYFVVVGGVSTVVSGLAQLNIVPSTNLYLDAAYGSGITIGTGISAAFMISKSLRSFVANKSVESMMETKPQEQKFMRHYESQFSVEAMDQCHDNPPEKLELEAFESHLSKANKELSKLSLFMENDRIKDFYAITLKNKDNSKALYMLNEKFKNGLDGYERMALNVHKSADIASGELKEAFYFLRDQMKDSPMKAMMSKRLSLFAQSFEPFSIFTESANKHEKTVWEEISNTGKLAEEMAVRTYDRYTKFVQPEHYGKITVKNKYNGAQIVEIVQAANALSALRMACEKASLYPDLPKLVQFGLRKQRDGLSESVRHLESLLDNGNPEVFFKHLDRQMQSMDSIKIKEAMIEFGDLSAHDLIVKKETLMDFSKSLQHPLNSETIKEQLRSIAPSQCSLS